MKCIKLMIIVVLILVTQTACWDNKDITKLALVSGVALDKAEDGKIEITVQIVKPSSIKPGGDNTLPVEKGYVNLSGKGETFYEANRDLTALSNKPFYWGYNQIIIISDALASEGISRYLDAFERGNQTSQKAYIIIAKDMEAKSILEFEGQFEKIPAIQNVNSLKTAEIFSKSYKINLFEFFKKLNQEDQGIALPVIYMRDKEGEKLQENLLLMGTAVIRKGNLTGYMDPFQTRGYLYTQNKVKNAAIDIQGLKDKKMKTVIDITHCKGIIKALIVNDRPVLSIEVEAEGNITEQQDNVKIISSKEINEIQSEVENKICQEIQSAVEKTQSLKCDVFGFCNKLNENYHREWKNLSQVWNEVYSKSPVSINVDFKLRRGGLINEPSEAK